MEHPKPEDARNALEQARAARAEGAERAARPGWYYPAMGGSLLIAFASFSLGMAPAGVAVGAVIAPVAIEALAWRSTGAAPLRSYTELTSRKTSYAFVLTLAALVALGLSLEKAADLTGAMAVCGLAALALTVVAGRRVDRSRTRQPGRRVV